MNAASTKNGASDGVSVGKMDAIIRLDREVVTGICAIAVNQAVELPCAAKIGAGFGEKIDLQVIGCTAFIEFEFVSQCNLGPDEESNLAVGI